MRTGLLISLAAWLVFPAAAAAQAAQAASAAPAPQATGASDLILAIDARRTTAQGTSSAGDHGSTSFESYTYSPTADLCGLGTGDAEPSRAPWVGWYFKADVLGSSTGAAGPELNVRIRWERRWENGARTNAGPVGTNTVTMRGGDVLVLDRIAAGTEGRCGSELRLEASVMSASARSRGMRGTALGRGGFAGAGGGRGGVAGGAAGAAMGRGGRGGGGTGSVATGGAGGTGTTSVASGGAASGGRGRGGTTTAGTGTTGVAAGGPRGTGTTTVSGRGGRGGAATAGTAATATTSTVSGQTRGGGRGSAMSASYQQMSDVLGRLQQTAEVWLIHRTPDGIEHVQQQTIQFGRSNRDFSFPPVAVNTSRGVVMVDINGSLRTAENGISIGLSRRARASGASPLDTTGSSEMAFERPKPEEVLSFEFPALQKPAEDLLAKHRFSVRVRIK